RSRRGRAEGGAGAVTLAGEAIAILSAPATVMAPERFLAVDIGEAGERILWDARAEGANGAEGTEEGAFAGRGAAARIEAWGPDRARVARDAARQLFGSIFEPAADAAVPDPPTARLFGGLSFQADPAGGARSAPWSGFADASFVLPRWLYCVSAR